MNEAKRDLSPFEMLQQLDEQCRQAGIEDGSNSENAQEWTGVLCRIGRDRVLAPMSMLHEIVPVPEIVRVPGVKRWVRGVTNLHGALVPVVDMQGFLFAENIPAQESTRRMLVVSEGARRVGVLVNEVFGMKHFWVGDEVRDLPLFDTALEPYITAALKRFDEHYAVLNLQKLLDDKHFRAVTL